MEPIAGNTSIWAINDDTARLAELIRRRKQGFPLTQKELEEYDRIQQKIQGDMQRGILTSAI